MWSDNHGGSLVFADKRFLSFDCAWRAPHNNIWANVELSFLKDSSGMKNEKWPPLNQYNYHNFLNNWEWLDFFTKPYIFVIKEYNKTNHTFELHGCILNYYAFSTHHSKKPINLTFYMTLTQPSRLFWAASCSKAQLQPMSTFIPNYVSIFCDGRPRWCATCCCMIVILLVQLSLEEWWCNKGNIFASLLKMTLMWPWHDLVVISTSKAQLLLMLLFAHKIRSCWCPNTNLTLQNILIYSQPPSTGIQRWGFKCAQEFSVNPYYSIWIFTHLKLCLADATHNFKWVKIIQIWQNGRGLFANLAD